MAESYVDLHDREGLKDINAIITEQNKNIKNPDVEEAFIKMTNIMLRLCHFQRRRYIQNGVQNKLEEISECTILYSDQIKADLLELCRKYEDLVFGLLNNKIDVTLNPMECSEFKLLKSAFEKVCRKNILQKMYDERQIF